MTDTPVPPEPPVPPVDPPKPEPTPADSKKPTSRDEALNQLRGDSDELRTVRAGEILSRGINRLDVHQPISHLTVVQGDFAVQGDFNSGPGGKRGRSGPRASTKSPINATHVVDQTEFFVEPVGHSDVLDMLAANNLAVIAARKGIGRYTAALAALTKTASDARLFTLNGNVLGNTVWRVPDEGAGYVVIDQPDGQRKYAAESIDDAWLIRTSEALKAVGSFLVVVTGPPRGAFATATRLSDFVVTGLEIPDPVEVVHLRVGKCLQHLAPDDVTAALSATDLDELLSERDDPRFATRAANAIIDALQRGDNLAEVVAKLRDPEDQVREWLESDPPMSEVAFTFATAVLEESSYLTVADAAIDLHVRLSSGSGGAGPRYLKGLAERTWIQLTVTDNDDASPEMISFRHADLRRAVLDLVWYELDAHRPKMMDWLGALADHDDVEVRARAAMAAGILAVRDFNNSLRRYLWPWAEDSSPTRRLSASLALSVVGSFAKHSEQVWTLLGHWADSVRYANGPRYLPATAALTAGGPLGEEDPKRALRLLRTLVCEGDWDLLDPSARCAHLLIDRGRDREVLDALMDWTAQGGTDEPVVKALTMFVFAARVPGADDRPALLTSIRSHRDTLPELWGRALSCAPVRELATGALREWVSTVDTQRDYLALVTDMFAGIADRGDADHRRILHSLEEWAKDEDRPLDAAIDIHDALIMAEANAR